LRQVPFEVQNRWFRGDCRLKTYAFEELLGTKLRALYQRKKGRDLFDLQVALQQKDIAVDVDKVMQCYNRYMEFVVDKAPTYKQYMQNMELKMQDKEFLGDTDLLLRQDAVPFNPQQAFEMVKTTFIDRMPGRRD
jgi:predicted nucleotidyltransferase component of viral defense system